MKTNKVKTFWVNLPVKDVKKSKEFFNKLGFQETENQPKNDEYAGFYLDENKTVLMLFPEERFAHFAGNPIADTSKGTEVYLNLDAPTKEYVDEFAEMVKSAGGRVYAEPSEVEGWMYVMGFIDLDGHRWGMLHMDMSQLPK